jgi:uncharacterized membrane protein YhiD involved in acid resistance
MIGLRTNVLVSIGAFMFMSCSSGLDVTDQSRIAAQIVSGIGFLGAGVILRDGSKVKGLNTAATLWCVAAIGVLTAFGMTIEATIGTIFILLSNIILRLISQRIMDKVKIQEKCIIDIICDKEEEKIIRNLIIKLTNKYNLIMKGFERIKNDDNKINLKINIISNDKFYFDEIAKYITTSSNIDSIYIEHNKLINSDNEDIDDGYALAYVWNKTDEWCSEFGSIGVRGKFGGIVRM